MSESHTDFAKHKVMIICAPNGARRTRSDHPAIPLTASQLASEAGDLLDQQVSVLHLHVRDAEDRHSLDADIYRGVMASIEKAIGNKLIIQITSESAGMYDRHVQMDMIRSVRPEAVSMAMRELCPDESAESQAGRFYEFLLKEGIWAQHILYSVADVARFDNLRRRGVFGEEHPVCLLVLGNYSDATDGSPEQLEAMHLQADFTEIPWGVCCFGGSELQCMLIATGQGGHVRLGFENNLWLEDGSVAISNSALIRQYNRSIDGGGRLAASADEVRGQFLTNF